MEKTDTPIPETAVQQEPNALMPDGAGLSLEHIRSLLAQVHETVVPKDDPILMVVTLLNAYLGEVERLQARHEKGLGKLMAEKTDAYVAGVHAATGKLSESLSSASVEGIRKVFDDHAARLAVFKSNVSWTALIVALSALANVTVFILARLR